MPGGERRAPYLCGQLYATLEALSVIGTGGAGMARPEEVRRAMQPPRTVLLRHLRAVGEHLHLAVRRSPAHAEAAAEVFAAIPGFVPAGGLPAGNLGVAEAAEFTAGYEAQRSVYEEKHGPLMRRAGRAP
ncbi:hypothetical protein AB0A69_19735 [Streptomyces sp. NPDC045431]|uniref:hypothetical protein n=1 Tax=Streptomyces sp. NPDC045431 TaxID=3155613 RepID=UPI0034012862